MRNALGTERMPQPDDREVNSLGWRVTFIVAGTLLGIAVICLGIAVFRSLQ
jgi:hypothetical protein